MNDQALFAAWSGDHNPMHVDAVAARRLLSGLPVVHGMHTVLELLARWSAHAPEAPVGRLAAEFSRPVNVGDTVEFRAEPGVDGSVRLLAVVDGQAHAVLTLQAAAGPAHEALLPPSDALPPLAAPLSEEPQAWIGAVRHLPGVHGTLPAAERVSAWLGPAVAGALGQLSTLVGMVCPGLHSIFSSFDVAVPGAEGPAGLRFRALRHEPRFRLLEIEVDGPLRGRVRAFVRPPPQPQPSMQALCDLVAPGEFAGRHAWVLGGSRGLGEVVAKLAAAGGADVSLTYAVGREDAGRVAAEIAAAGRGRAGLARYVAGSTAPGLLCQELPRPDAVFFLATPRIARRRKGLVDADLHAEFVRCYVDALAALAVALDGLAPPQPVRVFNPSSVYIDELPGGMLEYAMAKAASEVMGRDLGKRLRGVEITSLRLPRLATDQTAGLLQGKAADAASVLLPVVRQLLAGVA